MARHRASEMTVGGTTWKRRMETRGAGLASATWLLLAFGHLAEAQTPLLPGVDTPDRGAQNTSAKTEPQRIFREIADRHTRTDWLLVPDPAHPGGPGRFVRAELSGSFSAGLTAVRSNQGRLDEPPRPVIHVGDKVVVEEHGPTVEACLEAVALEPAAVGSVIGVRLKFGGKVVRVVAVGPGRTALREASR